MRYFISRAAYVVCALGLVLLVKPTSTGASDFTKLTYFTFTGAVQVPGVTLPAGTYQFRLADPDWGRNIVLIQDKRGRTTYAACFTRPDYREEADDAEITLHETREGMPPAVHAWFYAGEVRGYELIYSGKQKRKLALTNGAAPVRTATVTK